MTSLPFRLAAGIALLTVSLSPAIAADSKATQDKKAIEELTAAKDYAKGVLGSFCDFPEFEQGGDILESNHVYRFNYHLNYETDADPFHAGILYELHCMSGAYNAANAYVIKNDYNEFEVLTFAVPAFDVQYEDPETYTKLKEPPKITGYRTQSTLTNSSFDPKTLTITENSSWRGLGDAWSQGTWSFVDGTFVLKEYIIDPIYNLNADDATPETDPDNPKDAIRIFPQQ